MADLGGQLRMAQALRDQMQTFLDLRSGEGHVIAFNFNPLHRDLNRGDQRLLWNAIINWQAILAKH